MAATKSTLTDDLKRLGVRPGDTLMAHAGVRAVGRVIGGAAVIVQALLDSVGTDGTLVAYVDFEPFFYESETEQMPVFDKRVARAARDNGVLSETIRTWPGALRSDHPDAGVAAIGARAEWITTGHPFHYGYGEGTPFERIIQASGRVLMLGAPLDTITLLHHAEHKARLPGKRVIRYKRLMPGRDGPAWIGFEEFDTSRPVVDTLPSNCFEMIALDYLAAGRGYTGTVGAAKSYLFDAKELVEFAVAWLERLP